MTPDEISAIYQQHATIMSEIQQIYLALAVVAFLALLFLACMFGAAAWSVRMVNNRQRELEGKFSLLIDILLERARREMQARQVEINAENVEVVEHHG